MNIYDLCVAWNWEYDADWVGLLETACKERRVSLLQVRTDNLPSMWQAMLSRQLGFRVFLDRASDERAEFLPLADWARRHTAHCINARERASLAWDKSVMHWKLSAAGLPLPQTLILPPFRAQPELPAHDLRALGGVFTIKPACRGGGQGVVNGATSWEEVLSVRRQFPGDRYLLQSNVVPLALRSRPAWFRLIYCAGQVHPCWWNNQTHVYTALEPEEETEHGLHALHSISRRIAEVCGLDLFSTEVALTSGGIPVVVDYVNDPIDLRLQSKTPEGVPDGIVRSIAGQLASLASQSVP